LFQILQFHPTKKGEEGDKLTFNETDLVKFSLKG